MEICLSQYNVCAYQNSLRNFLGQVSFAEPVAITLTLKQGVRLNSAGQDTYVALDTNSASQNLRHFLNLLNAHYLGKRAKRFGERMPVISVLEGTRSKRFHYHLMADWPKNESRDLIAGRVGHLWGRTQWGYNECHVRLNADRGWINYITKLKDKSDLSSSIDWENCFLPHSSS